MTVANQSTPLLPVGAMHRQIQQAEVALVEDHGAEVVQAPLLEEWGEVLFLRVLFLR